MKFVGAKEHKNFILQEDFSTECSLIVLTGKNGAGKTRLFESMAKGGGTSVICKGEKLDKGIVYISQNELTPRVEGVFQSAEMGLKKNRFWLVLKLEKKPSVIVIMSRVWEGVD